MTQVGFILSKEKLDALEPKLVPAEKELAFEALIDLPRCVFDPNDFRPKVAPPPKPNPTVE